VTYTATVGGTQDADTSTALKATVDGDEADVNNGAVEAEAGQTVRFYLADTSLTVAAPTYDKAARNGLKITSVTPDKTKAIPGSTITYTVDVAATDGTLQPTDLKMTAGANTTAVNVTEITNIEGGHTYKISVTVNAGATSIGAANFSLVDYVAPTTPAE
jgi:hypothetical protein